MSPRAADPQGALGLRRHARGGREAWTGLASRLEPVSGSSSVSALPSSSGGSVAPLTENHSPRPQPDSRFGPIPRRGAEIKTVRSHRTESLVPLDPRSRSQVAGPGPSPRRTAGAREDPTNRALDSRCRPLRDPLVSLLRRPAGPWVGAAGEASAQYSRDSPRGQGQLQSKRTSPGVTGGPSMRPRGSGTGTGRCDLASAASACGSQQIQQILICT